MPRKVPLCFENEAFANFCMGKVIGEGGSCKRSD